MPELLGTRNTLQKTGLSEASQDRLRHLESREKTRLEQLDTQLSRVAEKIVDIEKGFDTEFISTYVSANGIEQFKTLLFHLSSTSPDRAFRMLKDFADTLPAGEYHKALYSGLVVDHSFLVAKNPDESINMDFTKYSIQVWRQEIVDHIVETLRDANIDVQVSGQSIVIDDQAKSDILEHMMAAWKLPENQKDNVYHALMVSMRADETLRPRAVRDQIQAKMEQGRRGKLTEIIDITSQTTVKVLTGGGFLDIPQSMLGSLELKFTAEHDGRIYAMLANGCEGNLAIIEGGGLKDTESPEQADSDPEQTKQQAYEKVIEEAQHLEDQKNYAGAKAKYQEAKELLEPSAPQRAAIEKKIGECDTWIQQQEKEKKEKQYTQIIGEGDTLKAAKDYVSAKAKYEQARGLDPSNARDGELATKIKECDQGIQQQEKEQKEAQYTQMVGEGDALKAAKDYAGAKEKYEQARDLGASNADPAALGNKIQECDQGIQQQEKENRQKQYAGLVSEGDDLQGKKEYQEAINKFQAAINLDPGNADNTALQEKIKTCKSALQAQDEAVKNRQFDEYMQHAQEKMAAKDYAGAKVDYEAALNLKPSDARAQQGKAEAEKKQQEQQEAKEKQEKYEQAVLEGERLQKEGNYEQAIASYEQAQKIDPINARNPELDSKIAACKQEVAKTKPSQEKLDEEFTRLVQEGDSAINKSDRNAAVDNYVAALKIKDDATVRARLQHARDQGGTETAGGVKVTIEVPAEIQYTAKKSEADGFRDQKQRVQAIQAYQAAKAIDGSKTAECEREIVGCTQSLVSQADGNYSLGILEQAQGEYKEALKHNPTDPTRVQGRVHEIEGDLAVRQSRRQDAVDAYTAAKKARPSGDHALIQQKLDYAQSQIENAKKADYTAIVTEGDRLQALSEFTAAKAEFEKARKLDPSNARDAELVTKIQECDQGIQEQEKAKTQAQYTGLVSEGDELQGKKEYQDAIKKFQAAIDLDPGNADNIAVQAKVSACQEALQAQDEAVKKQQFDKHMQNAQEKLTAQDYTGAIAAYQAALNLKPNDLTALQGKAEAEKKRQEQQETKKKQENYDHAVQEGQRLQASAQYEQAIVSYEQAQKVDPTNTRNTQLDAYIAQCRQAIEEAQKSKPGSSPEPIITGGLGPPILPETGVGSTKEIEERLPPVVATEMAVDMKPYAGFELGKSFNREALVADQTTIEQALTAAKQKQTQEKQEAQRNTEQINQNTNQIQGIERTLPDQQRRLTALGPLITQQKDEVQRLESKTRSFLIKGKIAEARAQLASLEQEQTSLQRTVETAQQQIASKKKENLRLERRNQEIALNQPILTSNIASLTAKAEAMKSLRQQSKERQIANARIEEWFLKQVADDAQLEKGMTWDRFVRAINAIQDKRLRQETIRGFYYQVENDPSKAGRIALPIDETMVTLFGASPERDGLYTANELTNNQNKVSQKVISLMSNPRRMYREGNVDIAKNEVLQDARVPADIKTAYLKFLQGKYPPPQWKGYGVNAEHSYMIISKKRGVLCLFDEHHNLVAMQRVITGRNGGDQDITDMAVNKRTPGGLYALHKGPNLTHDYAGHHIPMQPMEDQYNFSLTKNGTSVTIGSCLSMHKVVAGRNMADVRQSNGCPNVESIPEIYDHIAPTIYDTYEGQVYPKSFSLLYVCKENEREYRAPK